MPATPLPTPQTPVLIFDGDCAFCSLWVERLRTALPRFPEAVPSQWIDYTALGLRSDDVENYVWFATRSHQYSGHLAVSALLRGQPHLGWRFAGFLIATPPFSWIAALGYRFVARFRHRLPGGTPACALPPSQRA